MQESKYIKILKTLSPSERKEFNKYFLALYGKQEKIVAIYKYIHKFSKYQFVHPKLENKYVRQKVFNAEMYEGKGLSNPMSALNVCLEEFLRWKKINKDAKGYEKDKLQLEIYKDRRLDDLFLSEIENVKKKIKKAPLDMWQHLKFAEVVSLLHYSTLAPKLEKKKTTLLDFKKHIDHFYENINIKITCELEQRKEILADNKGLRNIEAEKQDDYFTIYSLLLDIIEEKEGINFKETKNSILRKLPSFSIIDQSIILTQLTNYCNQKIKSGVLTYKWVMFDIYKYMLKEIILGAENKLSHVHFNNMVDLGVKTNNLPWVKMFIKDYGDKIDPKHLTEDSIKIAKASIHFGMKEYAQVIQVLNEVKFLDMDHAMRVRWLLLCSHFEVNNNSQTFKYFCDAYEIFFKRNEVVNAVTIEGSLNLLKFIKLLNKPHEEESLFEQVLRENPMYFKSWLLKKIKPTFQDIP